jgi:hypothetical protein
VPKFEQKRILAFYINNYVLDLNAVSISSPGGRGEYEENSNTDDFS